MKFSAALRSRRSIRSFLRRPVKRETIHDILLDAIESPSSSNIQPYKVAIADGDKRIQLGQELLARYYKINKIQRQPLPPKLLSAATSQAMPDDDYNPFWVSIRVFSNAVKWLQAKVYMKLLELLVVISKHGMMRWPGISSFLMLLSLSLFLFIRV